MTTNAETRPAKPGFYPRIPLRRRRWPRVSFGLAALFGVVTAVAVVAAAANMPRRLRVLFAADVWLSAAGVYFVCMGRGLRRDRNRRSDANRYSWAYIGAGLALAAFAGLTFAIGVARGGGLL
jgi:hypothetical protein